MSVLVRQFHPADAPSLAELFHRSLREAGLLHYIREQVRAWSPSPPDPADYVIRASERTVLVATDENEHTIGYGDIGADGFIDHLYCHPDHVGRGVGSELLAAIETSAVANGVSELRANASEGLRRLLSRRGFQLQERQDLLLRGVPIHNYRMRKIIG